MFKRLEYFNVCESSMIKFRNRVSQVHMFFVWNHFARRRLVTCLQVLGIALQENVFPTGAVWCLLHRARRFSHQFFWIFWMCAATNHCKQSRLMKLVKFDSGCECAKCWVSFLNVDIEIWLLFSFSRDLHNFCFKNLNASEVFITSGA